MAKSKSLTEAVEGRLDAATQLATDAELARLRAEVASLKGRYKSALQAIDAEQGNAAAGRQDRQSKAARRHDGGSALGHPLRRACGP
jgi:hypothetical protein